MDFVLLFAALIAAVVLLLGIYTEAQDHRDKIAIWHDQTSGHSDNVEYRNK